MNKTEEIIINLSLVLAGVIIAGIQYRKLIANLRQLDESLREHYEQQGLEV